MKNHISLPISLAIVFLASCAPKENNNDQTSIHARADSAVGARMQEINQEAMESLEKRIAVEVKAKADSIIAARNGAPSKQSVKDTVNTRRNMQPTSASAALSHEAIKR